jgi:hypothetical protein
LRWQGSIAGGKNFVINGGMDNWQRGTSFSNPVGAYTADRFAATWSAPSTYTVSQQASFLTSSRYALRLQRTSGTTSTASLFLGMGFETNDVVRMQGKTMTWSFYVKAGSNFSATSSSLGVTFAYGTGIDQGPFVGHTGEVNLVNTSQVITTTSTRYSYTFAVPTTATSMRWNFNFAPTGTASTNDFYEIANMQLEIGSVATEFSRSGGTFQGELAACQRYYWRNNATSGNPYGIFGTALGFNTTDAYGFIAPPVTMRTVNSITTSNLALLDGAAGLSAVTVTLQATYTSNGIVGIKAVAASGITANRAYQIQANNTSSAFVAVDGEL